MRTIWKYSLQVGENTVTAPTGAALLHFDHQPGQGLMLWFAVDPAEADKTSDLRFNVVGTGWEWDEGDWTYLATVANLGPLVWHLLQGEL